MSHDFSELESWARELLASISPAGRARLAADLGRDIRSRHAKRIADQQSPDGTPFAPRAPAPKALRGRKGAIRRRGKMFSKLHTLRFLKATSTADEVAVGFTGRAATIARVHQEGQRRRTRTGQTMVTPQRVLVGLSDDDRQAIGDAIWKHMGGAD